MNLGVIYIRAALVIVACGVALGAILTVAFLLLRRKRVDLPTALFAAAVIGLPLACVGLVGFYQALFRAWHRSQNEAVPKTGCLTYEPSFWHLHASYKMDRQSFDAWAASHPWGLKPCEPEGIFKVHDGPHFGLTSCEAACESPPGSKGNSLRAYYNAGIVYLSYNVM